MQIEPSVSKNMIDILRKHIFLGLQNYIDSSNTNANSTAAFTPFKHLGNSPLSSDQSRLSMQKLQLYPSQLESRAGEFNHPVAPGKHPFSPPALSETHPSISSSNKLNSSLQQHWEGGGIHEMEQLRLCGSIASATRRRAFSMQPQSLSVSSQSTALSLSDGAKAPAFRRVCQDCACSRQTYPETANKPSINSSDLSPRPHSKSKIPISPSRMSQLHSRRKTELARANYRFFSSPHDSLSEDPHFVSSESSRGAPLSSTPPNSIERPSVSIQNRQHFNSAVPVLCACASRVCPLSPVKQELLARNSIVLKGFKKLAALFRGRITRELFSTEKVSVLVRTIKDTAKFTLSLYLDNTSPEALSSGTVSLPSVICRQLTAEEAKLETRLKAQLHNALHQLHEIFIEWPRHNQINLLRTSQAWRLRKLREEQRTNSPPVPACLAISSARSATASETSASSSVGLFKCSGDTVAGISVTSAPASLRRRASGVLFTKGRCSKAQYPLSSGDSGSSQRNRRPGQQQPQQYSEKLTMPNRSSVARARYTCGFRNQPRNVSCGRRRWASQVQQAYSTDTDNYCNFECRRRKVVQLLHCWRGRELISRRTNRYFCPSKSLSNRSVKPIKQQFHDEVFAVCGISHESPNIQTNQGDGSCKSSKSIAEVKTLQARGKTQRATGPKCQLENSEIRVTEDCEEELSQLQDRQEPFARCSPENSDELTVPFHGSGEPTNEEHLNSVTKDSSNANSVPFSDFDISSGLFGGINPTQHEVKPVRKVSCSTYADIGVKKRYFPIIRRIVSAQPRTEFMQELQSPKAPRHESCVGSPDRQLRSEFTTSSQTKDSSSADVSSVGDLEPGVSTGTQDHHLRATWTIEACSLALRTSDSFTPDP